MNNPYEMKLEMLAKNDSACEWARDEINKLRAELDEHKAARRAYASEFAPNADGEPDVGSIHQNIRGLKAKFKDLKEAMKNIEFFSRGTHVTVNSVAKNVLKICGE